MSNTTTSWSDAVAEALFYPWITLSFLIGTICLLFNSVTFSFYKNKRSDTISLLYTALSMCDMMAGVSAILNGAALVMVMNLSDNDEGFSFVLNSASAFATSITSHVSVFYNTVLMVVRTINMIFPFYKTKNNLLKASFVTYIVIWVIISAIDLSLYVNAPVKTQIQELLYFPGMGSGIVRKLFKNQTWEEWQRITFEPSEEDYTLDVALCICVPYFIPALICMLCFIVQAKTLLKKGGSRNSVNRRITVTILYLTLTFLICNSAYFMFAIGAITTNIAEKNRHLVTMITHFAGAILIFLNSALNPIILIVRGKDLQRFAKKLLSMSGSEDGQEGCTTSKVSNSRIGGASRAQKTLEDSKFPLFEV